MPRHWPPAGRFTTAAAVRNCGARAKKAATSNSCARIYVDCDRDTILLNVDQIGGAACHEGYKSCFFRQVTPDGLKVVGQRVFDPAAVYGKK